MRKVAVIGVAVVATLTFASSAQAASTSITSYGEREFGDTGFHVAFGQVFSSKSSCSANRRVKLVSEKGGKRKLLDSGVSSADGAISGGYLESRVGGGTLKFIASKTRKCKGATAKVEVVLERAANRRAAAGTIPAILGVNGNKQDGAFVGLILIESPNRALLRGQAPKCFANRKMSLYKDGELIDRGKSTHNGTWALHVTRREFNSMSEFVVKVRKSKKPPCGAGSSTFSPSPLSARWKG